ncbi:MAG: ATP-binding protein, partial [Polyangiaceae bacterium]
PIRDAAGTLSGVVLVFRDASEKRRIEEERRSLLAQSLRATKEAEAARAELEGLFMQAPAPICIVRGPAHVFAFANPAYVELVGTGRALVGLSVREALPELEGQGFYELLDGVYRTGERFVGESVPIKLQRGAESVDRFLTFIYDAFRDIDDNIVGVLVMAFDVTDNVLARQSVQTTLATTEAARRDAEAASRTKDEFLATASHELRTPLSAILGWARMLRGETLDAASFVRGLEVIERNAQVQVQLIEDMLDGSRIISGKLHLEIRSLDFAIVVQAAVDAVRPAAAARNIGIEVALGATERLRGDPDRLQQVVWNLLNNAIKFTPKGGHIHVELGRSGTHIELVVRDSGQGIEGDFLPHVFDRFRQADGTSTRRHGGLGLGLALVRHLVEAHGGSVRAASEGPGKGATFTVLLPVLAVYPDVAPIEGPRLTPVGGSSPNAPRGSLSGLTILVVDDENDVRDLVATLLEMHGAVVKTAGSVEQAMTVLEETTPSILISDIGMPEADGYSLLRRVRALEGPSGRVPAIALTAYAREEDRRRAAEAGFQTHVAKPVDPSTLVRLVAETVSAARVT